MQAQKDTISSQRTQIDELKHDLLLKTQLEEDMVIRIRKAVREELIDEMMQIKSRLQSVEVCLPFVLLVFMVL